MSDVLVVCALACTGLYAGYLLAFHSGVMPAFRELPDDRFTEAMSVINRKVPGPLFLLLFLGSVVLPAASWLTAPDSQDGQGQLLRLAATGCALVGHLTTAVGNIPLNNALEASLGRGGERAAREAFESRWNTFHALRTACAVAAFLFMAASVP
ncbi:DUF1772 domain-containing protein [Streptomyces sp. NPDC002055]|uniref:anthrone oxygenase family protein n=1 Tax=Streptomyces sp. NPDC002055 TaxID=3154534 RepID=UPI0033271B54